MQDDLIERLRALETHTDGFGTWTKPRNKDGEAAAAAGEADNARIAALEAMLGPDFAPLTNAALRSRIAALEADNARLMELVKEAGATGSAARLAAAMLVANAEGCIVNHYAGDFEQQGEPGWLTDARADIAAFAATLAKIKEPTDAE